MKYILIKNSPTPTQKWNIGLSLRFNKEKCGVAGYTKKRDKDWFFSTRLNEPLRMYIEKLVCVIKFKLQGLVFLNKVERTIKNVY